MVPGISTFHPRSERASRTTATIAAVLSANLAWLRTRASLPPRVLRVRERYFVEPRHRLRIVPAVRPCGDISVVLRPLGVVQDQGGEVCERSAARSLLLGTPSEWRSSAAFGRRSAAYSVAPSTGAIALTFTPLLAASTILSPIPRTWAWMTSFLVRKTKVRAPLR